MTTNIPAARQDGEMITDSVRALLDARAERLRARLEMKAEEATVMVAEFRVGTEVFAIPLQDFRAGVPLKHVTPVPLSPADVIGIVRYQGRVITAFSLASLLRVQGWRMDPTVLLIVEPTPGHLVGLDCEQIPKPSTLPLAAIEKARARNRGAVLELLTPGLAQVKLLDLSALLASRMGNTDGN
ncbi:MAG TPA: chemotaxis protein CheW [Polyangiaceae bacterium]|nr:chemotaxis protein CheW [Polyangiaceae bacterium]